MTARRTAVIGYRDKETFLADELRKYADVVIATEDGSVGTKGNVIDAIRAEKLTADIIYACGPTPMLKALKTYAMENGIECYISLEEKMACGIGACLGCVCHSKDIDEHSNVRNKRICKDGPVFRAEEVELLTPDEQRERIALRHHDQEGGAGMNTKVTLAGVELKNPVMTCSGTFGSGMEYGEMIDLDRLGAVVTKGIANVPWPGNPDPASDGSLRRNVKCYRSSGTGASTCS